MRTQVGIVGAGPAGLLLSQLLELQGIESTVLERRDRESVERRGRAGVLEHGTAETLREAGVGAGLDAGGTRLDGIELRFDGRGHRIDLAALTGRGVTVYGQHELVRDLVTARLDAGGDVRFEIDVIGLADLDTGRPRISFVERGRAGTLECDFVVGADGFLGLTRGYLPGLTAYERDHPYAWLGVVAEVAPSSYELIHARHRNGFALQCGPATGRSPGLTDLYLQVPADTDPADWPDERIRAELHRRLATDAGSRLAEAPLLDRGLTPIRSFVATPMQYGRLLLAGDAAHVVPPTGAKGLNLAVADVRLLSRAFGRFYATGRDDLLTGYTAAALDRVWRATHFSWWLTSMLHSHPDDDFDEQLAVAQLDYVATSRAMATSLAENYTGLPHATPWSYP